MNVICPRCSTLSLVSAQAKRFTCKTCRLRFCRECQHWKVDRKQSYCAHCGAAFSVPPSAMPQRVLAVVIYVPLGAAIFLMAFRLQFWQIAMIALLPPVIYTSAYLAVFYRRTGLTQATRREVILLGRRTVTLATVVYVAMARGQPIALAVGIVILAMLVLISLMMRRSDAEVIRELQVNRLAWEAVLATSSWDAFRMQLADVRHPAEKATR